jgi:hypothetical protein
MKGITKMTTTATKTYRVTVIERVPAQYHVKAENAREAAENWEDGEFYDRDDEDLEIEGPCDVHERQPDGKWRKLPRSEWQPAPPPADPENARYVIRSVTNEQTDYWSNETGWGCPGAADVFTAAERRRLNLPIAGEWIALKPYSVLLLYPDWANDDGKETFFDWVEASDPTAAIALAQLCALKQNGRDYKDPNEFVPLLVIEGHHRGQPYIAL